MLRRSVGNSFQSTSSFTVWLINTSVSRPTIGNHLLPYNLMSFTVPLLTVANGVIRVPCSKGKYGSFYLWMLVKLCNSSTTCILFLFKMVHWSCSTSSPVSTEMIYHSPVYRLSTTNQPGKLSRLPSVGWAPVSEQCSVGIIVMQMQQPCFTVKVLKPSTHLKLNKINAVSGKMLQKLAASLA